MNCDIGLSVNPQPGDWYGIRDISSDRDTLAYCVIKYAYNGYKGSGASNSVIRHCEISNSENNAIELTNICPDVLTLDSCSIHENGAYGVKAILSSFQADGNSITQNTSGGIYIEENVQGTCGNLDYNLTNNSVTKGSGYSTSTGILVYGVNSAKPKVVFDGNVINGFSSTGIYLYKSYDGNYVSETGTLLTGNEIESNGTFGVWIRYASPAIYSKDGCDGYNAFSENGSYGIYCTNGSFPSIKETFLINNGNSNVYSAYDCRPWLGDGRVDGNNVFETSQGGYDFKTTTSALYTINAVNNFWGEYNPDTGDFYPDSTYLNYDPYLNENPCGNPNKKVGAGEEIPLAFDLLQNYPNPFNPSTSIVFDVPISSHVKLSIYNILGQQVRMLIDEVYPVGCHSIIWDGRDNRGTEVSSGIYFYLIETNEFVSSKKMLMIR